MKEIVLAKGGELVLKGLNRQTFEDMMLANIRRRLARFGKYAVRSAQSTVYIEPLDGSDAGAADRALEVSKKVFGLVSLTKAAVCEKDMEQILPLCARYTKEALARARTFKVEAKRSDKSFPLTSPQIMRDVGERLLNENPHLKVDVHEPAVVVYVEIRDFGAYIHAGRIPGAGGMPLGTGGRATLLLSGGIDSPVAGYMIAKRGVEINAVHFHSPPYTSQRAREKVEELARIMCGYCGRINLHVISLTEIQAQIAERCPEEYFTLVMRRCMMQLAQRVAEQTGSRALITGESIGQVASQTIMALAATDDAVSMPVFRPCIGLDKEEIVTTARKIGTFETSIQPYEDCCTVFTPKHPRTHPEVEDVRALHGLLSCGELYERALEGMETVNIKL